MNKVNMTAFTRTDEGQYFYDVVVSNKSLRYLARKWRVPIDEVKRHREGGRLIMAGKTKKGELVLYGS